MYNFIILYIKIKQKKYILVLLKCRSNSHDFNKLVIKSKNINKNNFFEFLKMVNNAIFFYFYYANMIFYF